MIKSVDMDTAERLKRLRGELTQGQVAAYTGVLQVRISAWEGGDLPKALETLAALATYYKVSTDYILGLTDIPRPSGEKVLDEEKQLARQLVAGRITDTLYDELAQELQARRTKAEASIREIEKKLQGVLDADRRTDRILDARKIGMNMLNHPDTQTANTWLHRHMRIVVWDRNAYKKMGMTSRFLVQFI